MKISAKEMASGCWFVARNRKRDAHEDDDDKGEGCVTVQMLWRIIYAATVCKSVLASCPDLVIWRK